MSGEARRAIGDRDEHRGLRADMVLVRASDVMLSITAANTVGVETAHGTVDIGHHGLRILDRFTRPTRLDEVAAEPVAGEREWVDLLSAVRSLVEHGVLSDVEDAPVGLRSDAGYTWDNAQPHIQMLDDVPRTARYIAAIERTVRPGDVVVDIGTGTGVLAMAAARAGARHVYAIEAGAIAGDAEAMIAANGLDGVITVVRGWSTALSLPEPADVLVTETLGSDPFDERILEIVLDARERLLVEHPRIIPAAISLHAVPVEIPDEDLADELFTLGRTARWRREYGFDFDALIAREREVRGLRIPMSTTRGWRQLAPPVRLADIDLRRVATASVSAVATTRTNRGGRLDGAMLYFDTQLLPDLALSTDPLGGDGARHWWNLVSLVPATDIETGQLVQLRYGWASARLPSGLSVTHHA